MGKIGDVLQMLVGLFPLRVGNFPGRLTSSINLNDVASFSNNQARLDSKTIVINGASSRVGKSVAKEFARTSPANLKLILTVRRIDNLCEVAAEIQQQVGDGVKVLPIQLDVSQPQETEQFVPWLPEEFKDVDILVNNVCVFLIHDPLHACAAFTIKFYIRRSCQWHGSSA
ncbi:hypothetical protein BDV27DRAFT_160362 [Aspergillus caelatus]|uniref:Uncharacterized protein n=1 Tax=Aspergillus caelatus TaxID=61420 RepID=A0A5N6ZWB0_9EURO|nr:uncharacterized protein BDV27DRAFT_160362 [Aspergillus caelatus]KAE8361802.1 hypothetical protein BDV27DRAFT_160362 [Aspergillus caelatus]